MAVSQSSKLRRQNYLEAAPPPLSPAPLCRARPSSREFQEACVRASSPSCQLCHPAARSVSATPACGATQPNRKTPPNEMSHASSACVPLLSSLFFLFRGLDACCSLCLHVVASALIRALQAFRRIRTSCTCLHKTSSPHWRALRFAATHET